MVMNIAAGKFKARCLRLMEQVREQHAEVTITKRGRPVARLVPVPDEETRALFGYLQNTVTEHGDIVAPTGEVWNADT
jgi:prevent-host-death family protein